MQVQTLTREFKYNSLTLADPDSGLNPEQVAEIYSMTYPELTNTVVEGPEIKGGKMVYSFLRAVGSKGRTADQKPRGLLTANELIESLLTNAQKSERALSSFGKSDSPFSTKIASIAVYHRHGKPLATPSSAFGIWG